MNYNLFGLKYFIYITSLYKNLHYLPIEIRKIIWNKYHNVYNLNCYICNTILINTKTTNKSYNNENYLIMNGNAKCNKCFFD